MKLHEATKQLVTQFGQNVVAEVRLANLLADLNGYQEYPAMKQKCSVNFSRKVMDRNCMMPIRGEFQILFQWQLSLQQLLP